MALSSPEIALFRIHLWASAKQQTQGHLKHFLIFSSCHPDNSAKTAAKYNHHCWSFQIAFKDLATWKSCNATVFYMNQETFLCFSSTYHMLFQSMLKNSVRTSNLSSCLTQKLNLLQIFLNLLQNAIAGNFWG